MQNDLAFLAELSDITARRAAHGDEQSYVRRMLAGPADRLIQKIGEEATELIIAAKNDDDDAFLGEASDLLFHTLLVLQQRGLGLADVVRVLRARHEEHDS